MSTSQSEKMEHILSAVQEKYANFFNDNHTTIADYIVVIDNPVIHLYFKNGLPDNILNEVCKQLKC